MSIFLATASLIFASFTGLMSWYFLDNYFRLYLPNKQAVDECIPSGGTCSIDGFANLEVSGQFGLAFLILTIAGLLFYGWLFRRAMTSK